MTDCAAETLTSESPGALATIRTYDDLHAALRRRADELKITRLSMDEVGGMPPGYFGKVLAPEQIKLAGKHSLGALLGVLGCMLIMVEDPEAIRRFTARVQRRRFDADYNANETEAQFRWLCWRFALGKDCAKDRNIENERAQAQAHCRDCSQGSLG